VTFGFLVAGFLATTNAGRVGLACVETRPRPQTVAIALLVGMGLVLAAVAIADELLDALAISPESFRIAAGLVLAATGLRTIVWPRSTPGPFAAVLFTPELATLAVSFGVDESSEKVLGAAALALLVAAPVTTLHRREPLVLGTQFLAALQVVVAVALAVSGVRDV
jgi:small neutral amino acid transporter SnatA (MarC family)